MEGDHDFDDDVDEMKEEELPVDDHMRKMDIAKAKRNEKLDFIKNYKFKKFVANYSSNPDKDSEYEMKNNNLQQNYLS